MQDHCLWCPSCLVEAGRSLQGAGHASCLWEQMGAWWEQMPGLWCSCPSTVWGPERWMSPSQTAGLPVPCFPGGGAALKFCETTRGTLTFKHTICLRDRRGWHIHTSPQLMSGLRCHGLWERKVHIWKVNCLVLVCLLFTAYKCSETNLTISISFKFINPGDTAHRSKLGAGWKINRFMGL